MSSLISEAQGWEGVTCQTKEKGKPTHTDGQDELLDARKEEKEEAGTGLKTNLTGCKILLVSPG